MTEEERAALFRQQCANRAASRRERFAQLAGDPAAAAAVTAAFSPLLPAPLDSWDCPPRLEPGRPAWADRVPADVELPEYMKARRPR
jgi:hypothetical protein